VEEYVILLVVTGVIYLDAKTLKQENEVLYSDVMKVSPLIWTVWSLLLFIVAAPIYYYGRRKLLHMMMRSDIRSDVESVSQTEDISQAESIPQVESFSQTESFSIPHIDSIPQADEGNPYFGLITEATGLVILWFILAFCISLIFIGLSSIFQVLKAELIQYSIAGLLSNIVMVVLMYLALKRNRDGRFWKEIFFRKTDKFIVKTFCLPVVIGLGLACINFLILYTRGSGPTTPLGNALTSGGPIAVLFFVGMAILTAPFLEEMIFRGYFFTVISQVKGNVFSIWCITLVFALFHVGQLWKDWLAIVLIFCVGLCLTLLRSWTGSIIPGIITHFLYNTSMVVVIPILIVYLSSPPYFTYMLKIDQLDTPAKEQLLQKSIEHYPDFPTAYNDLAWIYAEQDKNLGDALILAEKALSLEPENPGFLDTKAEVFYKLGRYNEAIQIEEILVEKNPSVPYYQEQLDKYKEAKQADDT
jgi:membrane protease YdiL (CAAX protease family)